MVERCIEAKHSIAHLKGHYRRVTPAYLSLHLRMPQWERGLKRSPDLLTTTAAAFERLRKARRLAPALGLENHPVLRSVLGDRRAHTTTVWAQTSAVMYSVDPESQFATFERASRVNTKKKGQQARQRRARVRGGIPRPSRVSYADVHEKAQLDHFRCVACAGRVYSFPVALLEEGSGPQLLPLRAMLGVDSVGSDWKPTGTSGAMAALGAHADDEDDSTVNHGAQEGAQVTRRFVFSVVDTTPIRARVVPLPAGTAMRLGPDDIQIVAHVDHQPCEGADSGTISVGAAQVSSNPVLVLSRLGSAILDNPSLLEAWRIRDRIQYGLSGVNCSEAMLNLVTALLESGATPAGGKAFACAKGEEKQIFMLDMLMSFGFASCVQEDGHITLWTLTVQGIQCLELVRVICSPSPALASRGLPFKEGSTYEMLLALQHNGWEWVASKRCSQLEPYRTDIHWGHSVHGLGQQGRIALCLWRCRSACPLLYTCVVDAG